MSSPRSRIAIVDDDPGSRKTATDLLTPLGHDVKTYSNGRAFLDSLSEGWPDLVLCDVMMPDLDGLEVTRALRKKPELAALPIVLVTALDATSDRVAGLEAGADDFLSKPVHGPELRARVGNLLQVGAYRKWLEAEREAAKRQVDQVQQQLFHAERLATLGTFAAGISHELKNIVAVFSSMLGTLDRLPNGYLLDDEAFTALKQTTQHASELAHSVLQVSRANGPSDDRVELTGVVRDVTAMLRAAGRTRHLDVRMTLPSQPVTAHAAMLEVQQVLLNLIGNATDALGNKRDGRIEITLSSDDARAQLVVSDNGSGIPDHVKAKLFTPFFTTKPPGKGTGLGLSVIKQIVEKWHGSIDLESTVGQGTSVHVKLPLATVTADD